VRVVIAEDSILLRDGLCRLFASRAKLLAGRTSRIGYLLKDRVADVDEFVDAARRIAEGGTALDPEVVAQLLVRRRAPSPTSRRQTAATGGYSRYCAT
jgi:hypothetical protein